MSGQGYCDECGDVVAFNEREAVESPDGEHIWHPACFDAMVTRTARRSEPALPVLGAEAALELLIGEANAIGAGPDVVSDLWEGMAG